MAEERDVEGIEQYTRQLLQQQNTVNKLIMFSGSKVLDAIINSKSAAAERAGVRLSAIITTPLAVFRRRILPSSSAMRWTTQSRAPTKSQTRSAAHPPERGEAKRLCGHPH